MSISVAPVVVFLMTTWSVQLPDVAALPVLASFQLTVIVVPVRGLVGVMARPVTCKSG